MGELVLSTPRNRRDEILMTDSATLVVDTGMGPKNAATAARVAAKLAPSIAPAVEGPT
jgi:uncharacterized membrane-anchored protein